MGVPAFFRWLSRKYVSIIVDAVEERPKDVNGTKVPVDCTKPNQNYQEFDNLYLDMNGIIHPCTHPEDRPAPKTEEEMFVLIFEYIDRLFSIVRPRKLLYMAVDGVAPRAKMNQQRSRRFRASKEAADKRAQIAEIRRKLESEGIPLPPPRKEEEHFDSNCITPGTPFMARLAVALRYYIHMRITYDPAWKNIQVILSDANVPGEGEHKIMDYIRRQRASDSHDPNTVHCLCGADADLIMLGLATHEANFNIIREEFIPNQPRACELCGQYGHELEHCQGLARAEAGPDQVDPLKKEKNFIFIRLPVLREYLERELQMPNLPFPYDFERAIDDWVMMCFFVGNDFLPHLPSLEIRENAIDRLVKLYKNMVYQTGGWLTEDGEVNIGRVKMIMVELGKVEDDIFKERQLRELRFKESQKNRKRRSREAAAAKIMPYNASFISPQPLNSARQYHSGQDIRRMASDDRQKMEQRATEQAQKLKSLLTPVSTTSSTSIGSKRKADQDPSSSPNGAPPAKEDRAKTAETDEEQVKKPTVEIITSSGKPMPLAKGAVGALVPDPDDSEEEPEDGIRLYEAGWKDRYYQAKFQVPESDLEFRKKVACAYVEGLSWVLRYYYQGCASWTWFYPYHYAPFASDFALIENFEPDFSKPTRPFKPLEQLMGVFPAASRTHIPEGWRWLMTDPKSPIIDFYPEDFEIDLNGKKFAWQGVALLPFVDEKRLLGALESVYGTLTAEEEHRNMTGPDRLFIGKEHDLFEQVEEVYNSGKAIGKNGEEAKGVKEKERKEPGTEEEEEVQEVKPEEEKPQKSAEEVEKEEDEVEKNGEKNGTDAANGVVEMEEKRWLIIDATKTSGMAGEVSHDQAALQCGVSQVSMFRNSMEFGDIKENRCMMVEFRDPQFPLHFRFEAKRLKGIQELPKVLKPRDYDERRQGPFRPQVGFSRDIPHASLSSTGHRTLGHHIHEQNTSRRSYPPDLFANNYPAPPPHQPLPWHANAPGGRPLNAFPSLMSIPAPPMPPNFGGMQPQNSNNSFSYSQMAMPAAPPLPPQAWMGGQPQQQGQGGAPAGGGYGGYWGQPPEHVMRLQPQQQQGGSWRPPNQQPAQQWNAAQQDQQQRQQPYHPNSAPRDREFRPTRRY